MPRIAIIIVLGTLLAFYGNRLPDPLWSAYLPILLLLFCCNPSWRPPLAFAMAYLWSAGLLHYHLDHRLLETYDNRLAIVQGMVSDLPEAGNGRVRLLLDSVEIAGYPARMPRRLRLSWYQDEIVPRAGERWQFEVKLRQPRGLANPGAFDFTAWQFVRGIDAGGYIRGSAQNRRLEAAPAWKLAFWRTRLARVIDDYCADCRHRGLIKALALGYRGDIDRREQRLLRDSATAHLLAISGMHIGLVAGLAYWIGRLYWRTGPLPRRLNRREFGTLFALLAALVYSGLAGFSLPTVRALSMLLFVGIALWARQAVNLLNTLSLAVIFILLVDPRAVGSVSFWLSVGALLIIGYAGLRMQTALNWWRQLLLLQIYFSLLFAPVGALVFGQFSPAAFPANLVAIPAISFVVLPLVLLACLLSPAGAIWVGPLLQLADGVLRLLLACLEWLLSIGLEPWPSAYPPVLLLLLLGLSCWSILPGARIVRATAFGAALLLSTWCPSRPSQGEFEMTVFDVGMGTSVLLRTRYHSLVYDFGPGRAGVYSAADWGLMPALRLRGIDNPDLLIVSHVDQDHSGGLPRLLTAKSTSLLLSGTPQELRERFDLPQTPRSCHDYSSWRWDGVDFLFLPDTAQSPKTNSRSCVLLVRGLHRILLPGDIERAREQQLVSRYGTALRADVLLVPHHGSSTSSSRAFVQRVAPRHAIMTLAGGNRWGFPSADVSQRYIDVGARLYRSDRDGAVRVESDADGLSISTANAVEKRIWRRW